MVVPNAVYLILINICFNYLGFILPLTHILDLSYFSDNFKESSWNTDGLSRGVYELIYGFLFRLGHSDWGFGCYSRSRYLKYATATSLRIFSSLFFVERPTIGAVLQPELLTAPLTF
jgi:hypothetical protein